MSISKYRPTGIGYESIKGIRRAAREGRGEGEEKIFRIFGRFLRSYRIMGRVARRVAAGLHPQKAE